MVNIVKMCALTNQDIFKKKLENFIILFASFSIKIELLFVFLLFQTNHPPRA